MFESQQPDLARQRKDDHLRLALAQQAEMSESPFDEVRLIHHAFTQAKYEAINLTTEWGGKQHALPLYINAMTGGSGKTQWYNEQLAKVAKALSLPIATGSMSIALQDPQAIESFTVMREIYPEGYILTNLGAHHAVSNARRVIELIQADAIQIHLNLPQEIVMPEGDRDFGNWQHNIEQMVMELEVPVIVKEVGFGMSRKTIQQLLQCGVQTIDVSGRGGTNFAQIESDRHIHGDRSLFVNWGQTTPESLLAARPFLNQATILASGGIREAMHVIKALAMGASAVGVSGYVLHLIDTVGTEATIETLSQWVEDIRLAMLMLNAPTIPALNQVDWLTTGDLRAYQQDIQA